MWDEAIEPVQQQQLRGRGVRHSYGDLLAKQQQQQTISRTKNGFETQVPTGETVQVVTIDSKKKIIEETNTKVRELYSDLEGLPEMLMDLENEIIRDRRHMNALDKNSEQIRMSTATEKDDLAPLPPVSTAERELIQRRHTIDTLYRGPSSKTNGALHSDILISMNERVEWKKSGACNLCGSAFLGKGGRKRRHHCRMCGDSCCKNCHGLLNVMDASKKISVSIVCKACIVEVEETLG